MRARSKKNHEYFSPPGRHRYWSPPAPGVIDGAFLSSSSIVRPPDISAIFLAGLASFARAASIGSCLFLMLQPAAAAVVVGAAASLTLGSCAIFLAASSSDEKLCLLTLPRLVDMNSGCMTSPWSSIRADDKATSAHKRISLMYNPIDYESKLVYEVSCDIID